MSKKVWNTKIDDEDSEDDKPRKKRTKKFVTLDSLTNSDDDDEDEDKSYRTMFRLDDFDATISMFGIECIERKMRFVEKPKARWQYGIVINGGMEPSVRYPKTNLEAWFEKEEKRDERYEYLLQKLSEYKINVIKL